MNGDFDCRHEDDRMFHAIASFALMSQSPNPQLHFTNITTSGSFISNPDDRSSNIKAKKNDARNTPKGSSFPQPPQPQTTLI